MATARLGTRAVFRLARRMPAKEIGENVGQPHALWLAICLVDTGMALLDRRLIQEFPEACDVAIPGLLPRRKSGFSPNRLAHPGIGSQLSQQLREFHGI